MELDDILPDISWRNNVFPVVSSDAHKMKSQYVYQRGSQIVHAHDSDHGTIWCVGYDIWYLHSSLAEIVIQTFKDILNKNKQTAADSWKYALLRLRWQVVVELYYTKLINILMLLTHCNPDIW